ncbi:hypothetical protein LS684_18965 [Cytobacillus spongiae]|uniref:hypothetical protein n=1 Tax=Cytobacillus spongiae TaxID=2901381 RepID=UPI001F18E9FE|nr:hypothetical protein [Cytobacillus spongiae]UII55682.1 hypothetical protein LS684_18965 [Cytobacillus spongiae]
MFRNILILLVIFLFTFIAGCSNVEEEKQDLNKSQDKTSEHGSKEIMQNEKYTEMVLDEEGVKNGQVYEENGVVFGALVLEEIVSDERAKELANKYAQELKNEYKNLKVNVQAVRNGENVANITID